MRVLNAPTILCLLLVATTVYATDDDPCSAACAPNAECSIFNGQAGICRCPDGMLGDPTVNCAVPCGDCGANQFCEADGITCSCVEGYGRNDQNQCRRINDCTSSQDNICHDNADCINYVGNFDMCRCKEGYKGDGIDTCDDVNECVGGGYPMGSNNECHELTTTCTNTIGSYDCSCRSGYENLERICETIYNDRTGGPIGQECFQRCQDINECLSPDTNFCNEQSSLCVNYDGGYNCACKDGFRATGYDCHTIRGDDGSNIQQCVQRCDDVDECRDFDLNDCHMNALCINTLGSYTCECQEGYTGSGTTCVPVQCGGGCGVNEECVNDECQCKTGFVANDEGDCEQPEEEDPCSNAELNDCHENAQCSNVGGGNYRCSCREGYVGNGEECFPLEDCNCRENESCYLVDEELICLCQDPFVYSEAKCYHPDPCSDPNQNDCGENAQCSNAGGTGDYTCVCMEGYIGVNGRDCIHPDDFCNNCGVNAVCYFSNDGAPQCRCKEGYVPNGDGECEEEPHDAGMLDDPHVQMWNKTWFDWSGECDVVLVHAPNFHKTNEDLIIHVRTKIRYDYSFIEAAVLWLGDLMLEVGSWGDYSLNGVTSGSLSGWPIHRTVANEKHHIFQVMVGSNPNENITISTFKDMISVKIHGGLSKDFGNSVGMMGSFSSGQLLARDGITVMEDLNEFGQEWQVQPGEPMLFRTVRDPQAPTRCMLPSDVESRESRLLRRNGRRLLEEAAVSLDEATEACGYLEEGARKEACISDVLKVGDVDIALAGAY